jgi:mannonate dehydratase
MHRRDWLKQAAVGAAGLPAAAADKLPALKITDVKTVLTAPAGIRLVVVKVLTSEPGLYGLGCATFTQRARVVQTTVDKYLRPFLLGKDPSQIEDIWQSAFVSSYWRNGPVLGNALSGVDMALWDILGKRAGLPLYQLLGGKCRKAVDTYVHATGATFKEVEDRVRAFMERGWRTVRAQVAVPGLSTYGAGGRAGDARGPNDRAQLWEPRAYVRTVPKLFEHLRKQLGDEVELLHDMHERVPPVLAIRLARELEPYHLFFLEDPLSPEDVGYFAQLRQQTTTPIAMGELFNNPNEWVPLVTGRLIDFIRIHLSQIGGLTPSRKAAALCEYFAVRTLTNCTSPIIMRAPASPRGALPCPSARHDRLTAARPSASATSAFPAPSRARATRSAGRRPTPRRGVKSRASPWTGSCPASTPAARPTTAGIATTRPPWGASWSTSARAGCRGEATSSLKTWTG